MLARRALLEGPSWSRGFICGKCRAHPSTSSTFSVSSAAPTLQSRLGTTRYISRNFSSSPLCSAKQAATGKQLLPEGPARTRFAPSPTGYLHLGSLRTALFNYLLAKKTGGQFLLRIEDTDQKRLVADAEQRLCDDLQWAGIQWDEGPQVGGPYGPYKQSERTALYQEHAHKLLDSESAYRCFCTASPPSTVQADPSQIAVAIGGCQSDCASIPDEQAAERAAKGDRHVVRMRKPARSPSWTDLVYGKVSLDKSSKKTLPQNLGVDGVVLLKGDGTPTYHLANVVDDHHMKITHVIRGSEWMASTPLHVALYGAFGWTPPAFAHVGLLTDKDQAKLSKRNFDTDIGSLKQKHGILPETLVNFLALLGWRNPTRDDVMDLHELVRNFDLKFTKGNTIVSFEKLWFLQKHHAKKVIEQAFESESPRPSFENLVNLVAGAAKTHYTPQQYAQILGPRDLHSYTATVLLADDKNYENPTAYVERNKFFFTRDILATSAGDSTIAPEDLQAAVTEMLDSDALRALELPSAASSSRSSGQGYAGLKREFAESAAAYAQAIEQVCVRRAAEQASGAGEADEEAAKAAKLKQWRTAMHRFLREKLTFGLPGPGSSHLMTVLGYDECCRRIIGTGGGKE